MFTILRRYMTRVKVWWYAQNHETRSFVGYIVTAILNFARSGSGRAAALSYYALFSLFPLTLLLAIFITWLVGPVVAQEQIAQGLRFFLPDETVTLIQDNVLRSIEQGSGFTLIALVGLIWSGTGLFSSLTSAMEDIFHAARGRGLLRNRIIAAFMPLVVLVLIGLSFVTSGMLRVLDTLLGGASSLWLSIGILFLPFSINMLMFILLFRYVSNTRVHWEVLWPSAVLGAFGWEIAKAIFGWYLTSFGNYALVYGSIATVIILLLSTYLTASVLLLSAEVCARMNEWYDEHRSGAPVLSVRAVKALPPQQRQ